MRGFLMKTSNLLWNLSFWTVLLVLVASGICPYDRATWFMEVPWIFVGLGFVAYLHMRNIRISMLLGIALFIHALILIYGGYYTYEKVPLGFWMQDIFGFTRNHYDRIGHFAQGFFPVLLYREVLYRNKAVNDSYWLELIVFAFAMAFTCIFELIEFTAAKLLGGDANLYLGSQGDIWDAQWDMSFCGLGAIVSIILLGTLHKRQLTVLESEMNVEGRL